MVALNPLSAKVKLARTDGRCKDTITITDFSVRLERYPDSRMWNRNQWMWYAMAAHDPKMYRTRGWTGNIEKNNKGSNLRKLTNYYRCLAFRL